MSLLDSLLGKPLASEEEEDQKVGVLAGVPTLGLDALSSSAYGPEAALTILIQLGLASAAYILPISLTIIVLLSIVYFSYRQTIAAYPQGGGSYIVATANLGERAGLLAGAALMLDYILNVAVGISAGVGAKSVVKTVASGMATYWRFVGRVGTDFLKNRGTASRKAIPPITAPDVVSCGSKSPGNSRE